MYEVKLVTIAQNMRIETGWSIRKIASIMNISKTTIGRWLVGSRDTERKRGRPKIDIQVNELFPRFQYASLLTIVSEAKLACSITTLCRRLKETKITKKNIKHCISHNASLVNEKRLKFSESMQTQYPQDYISIDETSFYHRLNPLRGWSKVGEYLHLPQQKTISKRYSLITAITSTGLLSHRIIQGSFKAVDFASFIESLPTTTQRKILMDNAPIHKCQVVKDTLLRKGLVSVFTSPYSPEWNPVEFYFSQLKHRFRTDYIVSIEKSTSLEMRVNEIASTIPQSFFHRIFEHSFRHIKSNHHR